MRLFRALMVPAIVLLLALQVSAAGHNLYYYKKNPSFAYYPRKHPGSHATLRQPRFHHITTGHQFRAVQRVDHRSHLYHRSRTNGIVNNHARLRQTSSRSHGYHKVLPSTHYGLRSF